MIKRIVVSQPARGYVDGRFIGEEKEPRNNAGSGRGRNGRGKANANADSILGSLAGAGRSRTKRGKNDKGQDRGAAGGGAADNIGNTTAKRRGRNSAPRTAQTEGAGNGQAPRGRRAGAAAGARQGQGQGRTRGQGRPQNRLGGDGVKNVPGNVGNATIGSGMAGVGRPPMRKSRGAGRGGKKTPFRSSPNPSVPSMSPSQGADIRRFGDESKSGQFAEALAASANVKRERLHKILAQSGHGSRRDMEILISSGRLMVNGIVATAGTQVAQGDNVLLDLRPIKLKFSEELPRVLLYHKPEGEIVTTNDPGNRITVFDNLPRVENGKWTSIGRLDINTSGLLIFTTSGELANRFMHPRYEVEREYAVRILGELTEEQGQRLLSGVEIASDDNKKSAHDDDEDDDDFALVDYDDHSDDGDDSDDSDNNAAHHATLNTIGSAGNTDNIGNTGNTGNPAAETEDDPDAQPAYLAQLPPHTSERSHGQQDDHDDNDGNSIANGNALPAKAKPQVVRAAASTVSSIPLRDGLARFDSIEKRGGEGVNQWYHVVIKEGRNREVRKMFEAIGLTVSRLIRIRFGKIELPQRLARGKMMELDAAQVKSVLVSAGMSVEGATAPLPGRADAGAGGRQDRNAKRNGRERKSGQADGQDQKAQQTRQARPPNENRDGRPPREPRPPRNPRTAPRGQRLPREANEFVPNENTAAALDENGMPIVTASRGIEGDAQVRGQEPGSANGQRNGRRTRGGRGLRGAGGQRGARENRDARLPSGGLPSGDGASDGNSYASQLANTHESSGIDGSMGNTGNAERTATTHGADGSTTPRNPNRGRSRRNLRNRTPREPRDAQTGNADASTSVSTPPKENNGNE